jgi:hypothetical protein
MGRGPILVLGRNVSPRHFLFFFCFSPFLFLFFLFGNIFKLHFDSRMIQSFQKKIKYQCKACYNMNTLALFCLKQDFFKKVRKGPHKLIGLIINGFLWLLF